MSLTLANGIVIMILWLQTIISMSVQVVVVGGEG